MHAVGAHRAQREAMRDRTANLAPGGHSGAVSKYLWTQAALSYRREPVSEVGPAAGGLW
jgi:hypothetical protein